MTNTELRAYAARRAETLASSETDPCPRCGGDLYACTCPLPITELFYADALPSHMIAVTRLGNLHLVPVAPMGSEIWTRAIPYRGNYDVTPVMPAVREMYGNHDASVLS